MPIEIDYALAMAEGIGSRGGLLDRELDAEAPAFAEGVARIQAEVAAGKLGFWNLPDDRASLAAIDAWVARIPPSVTDVVVLGIGGSSLGVRAIYQALAGPPELVEPGPDRRRLHLPDNSDPWLLAALLERLDRDRTVAIAVSKSGGTVETAAQLLVLRRFLGPAVRERLAVVTDPARGPLRELASREGLTAFDVPPNVGGRFSVLCPVGLLPARLAGLDAAGLLDGAKAIAPACARSPLRENPAGLLAALGVLHQRLRGHGTHVLMPYSDALRPFAAWWVQIWAESLGKRVDRRGRRVEQGPTPIPAVGATDQHAQVQLFMEGPRDKLVTFIAVGDPGRDIEIPVEDGPFRYLGGKSLGTLLDAERRGTALALARDGRPSLTLSVPRVDARALGALFFLYEAATAFAGELYGIDAFDQPGVEEGKRLASGLLGRPGDEAAGKEVREAEAGRPSRYRLK